MMKVDATCCNAEVRYPTDYNLLEDGSELIDRLLDKFCARHKAEKPRTHRVEARQAFISLTKKKRKGKKLVDKVRLIQLRCLQADLLTFLDFLGGQSSRLLSCFSRHDCKCLKAAFKMYEQQKKMFDENVRRCADRIVSIYQPHLRPIVRGKAKAKVEFGAKIGASVVNGYTYVDHLSWDAYNESSDLAMQLELYKKRFGMLPQEVQADKLYLGKANRNLIKTRRGPSARGTRWRPHSVPPKGVYRANDIRAKLDDTADTWIGACFFAKNVMKFLRGLLCLIFAKLGLKAFKRRISYSIDYPMGVLDPTRGCLVKII